MGSLLRGRILKLGPHPLVLARRPLIMGILNLTPDSFSDGGQLGQSPQAIKKTAQAFLAAGADILDIGAESTRPGAQPITVGEEKRRLLPVLKILRGLPAPISVDTYKPEVAAAALDLGAHMINDITGLRDARMRRLLAQRQVPVIIMHMQGTPQTMQKNPRYRDVVQEVRQELLRSARSAIRAGIRPDRIILDPGIGFGKTLKHNLLLLQNLSRLAGTRYPILLGPSRKAFISGVLGPMPPRERIWGTAAAVAWAVAQGVQLLRVHDVREMRMVASMAKSIASGGVVA